MRKCIAISLFLLFVIILGSCAPPRATAVLNWNIGAEPLTIDPGLNGATDGADVINQTFEGLVREKSGVVQPGIAESWEVSEDGLTMTFNLRESEWSDGTPLTAHDFVYSWLRGMDPETASEYSWIWEKTNVVGAKAFASGEGAREDVGIRAVDDYTLEVKFNAPTPYFIGFASFFHFMPVKQSSVEAEGGEDGTWASNPELAVSNGPFMLTDYKIGESLTLAKNDNYWNAGDVKIATINAYFIDSETTAYQAYLAGDLDFIPSVPPAEIPRLMAEDPNLYIFPLLGTQYYNFNMDLEIFQDVRVRRAMSLAIDRQLIVDTLALGLVPAPGFVPPGFPDDKGNDFFETAGTFGIPTDSSGVAEAQQLLADAGFPNGEGFPEFTILYNTAEVHQLIAELVQEMFKTNLGINVTLENQEWAVFQETRKAGDYEMSRGGWLTDFMNPTGMLAIHMTGNPYNDARYSNPEFDAAMKAAAETTDEAEHFAQLYKAQEILMTDLPVIPLFHPTDMLLVSERVVGWDRSVLGTIDFSSATVER